jgi:hypothetical protein
LSRIKGFCIPTYRNVIKIQGIEYYPYVPIDVIIRIFPKELHNKGIGYIFFQEVERPKEVLVISFKPARIPLEEFLESRIHKSFKIITHYENLIDAYEGLLKNSSSLRLVGNEGYISRISLIRLRQSKNNN